MTEEIFQQLSKTEQERIGEQCYKIFVSQEYIANQGNYREGIVFENMVFSTDMIFLIARRYYRTYGLEKGLKDKQYLEKLFFSVCLACQFHSDTRFCYANFFGYNQTAFNELVDRYYCQASKEEKKQYDTCYFQYRKEFQETSKKRALAQFQEPFYIEIFNYLLSLEKIEEGIDYLEEYYQKQNHFDSIQGYLAYLYQAISSYCNRFQYYECEEKLYRFIYGFSCHHRKTEETDLEQVRRDAEALIMNFLTSSDTTINEFSKKTGITRYFISKALGIVMECNPPLYQKYLERAKENTIHQYGFCISTVTKIMNLLEMGICSEENCRPFDWLDYYHLTSIEPEDLMKRVKKSLSNEQVRTLMMFFASYRVRRKLNMVKELEMKRIVMVEENPHEVTKQEKLEVFRYLEKHHIPLYEKIYVLALNRHLLGNLYPVLPQNIKVLSTK